MSKTDVHSVQLKQGISRSPEFEKKLLATHGLNCGLVCGHGCAYCSTPSLVRAHSIFRQIGRTAFSGNLAVVDPSVPDRVKRSARNLLPAHTVMLATITDAWAPEAQECGLGRRCLEVLLRDSSCRVRVLTKNAAVARDYDIMESCRDRILVGLSLTAPSSKAHLAQVIEPHASTIPERIQALREAHERKLRTYGMLCPCLPGIADDMASLRELAEVVLSVGAEDVWLEPVNARGKGLVNTEAFLRQGGEPELADAIRVIRKRKGWSRYARRLIESAVAVAREMTFLDRLHVLLYPKRLEPDDRAALEHLPGVVWL